MCTFSWTEQKQWIKCGKFDATEHFFVNIVGSSSPLYYQLVMTEYILKVQKTLMPAPLKACAPKTTPPVDKVVNYDTFTLYSSLICQQME